VGGRLVYLLLLFILLLGASCGAGAAAIGYVGTTYPLVKESVLVAIETKEHEIADRVVDRLARKLGMATRLTKGDRLMASISNS